MPIMDDPRFASFKRTRDPLAAIAALIGPDDAVGQARLAAITPEFRDVQGAFQRETVNMVLADRYAASGRLYDWGRANLDADSLRQVSNYRIRLGHLVTLSGTAIDLPRLVRAIQTFDADNAVEEAVVYEAQTAFRRQQDEQRRRDAERAREAELARRRRNVLEAHNLVQQEARRTPTRVVDGRVVANMVAAVVDIATGNSATGRAGHQLGRAALEAATGIQVPAMAAHAFVVGDPTNCAEWEAVYNLLRAHPRTVKSELYFAAAVPGGSHLIPPCDNCKRWIRAIGARAHGLD